MSGEQYARAYLSVLVNYLSSKKIVDSDDFLKYFKDHIKDTAAEIRKADSIEFDKSLKAFMAELGGKKTK